MANSDIKLPDEGSAISSTTLLGVAILLTLIWGSAYTLVGAAVRTLAPEWLVGYRMIIGAAFIWLYSYKTGHRLPALSDKRWIWYAAIAVMGAYLPFLLLATGQTAVDSGLTAILVGTMPLITIILAHFFTPEKLTLMKLIGFFMGFVGIVILFLPKDLSFSLVSNWRAQVLILMASACYAVTTIIASRAPETPSAVGATMMLIIGTVLSVTWAVFTVGSPPIPDKIALFSTIALGLGSTGIATVMYLWVIDVAGPSLIARLNYFVPVCSVILGAILLKETLDWRIFVSLAIILLGVLVSKLGKAALRG